MTTTPPTEQLEFILPTRPAAASSDNAVEGYSRGAADNLAAHLPTRLHFGAIGRRFPHWRGLWSEPTSDDHLERYGLEEYARHRLLRCIELGDDGDALSTPRDLRRYAGQLGEGVTTLWRAPSELCEPRFHRAKGSHRELAGQVNPHFLNAAYFIGEVLNPLRDAFGERAGPVIIEFPGDMRAAGVHFEGFFARLEGFIAALPKTFDYAVDLRDEFFLTLAYTRFLAMSGAVHVFSVADNAPPWRKQLHTAPSGAPVVVRLIGDAPQTPRFGGIAAHAAGLVDAVREASAGLDQPPVYILVGENFGVPTPAADSLLALARACADTAT